MKLRCLIIDDEPPAREIMKTYVDDCPRLELVKICGDAFAAEEILQSQMIDLLLLDINLPRLSGLSFLKSLSHPPLVIFTTAYPEFALEGFETDAVDYLIKPFSFDRFLKAVNKAVEKQRIRQSSNHLRTDKNQDYILLRADKKMYKVNFDEIHYVESTGDYLKVYLAGKNLVIHETIKGFLDQLPPAEFIRIHKSYIVSVNRIVYIEGNRIRIDDKLIPVGRSYKEEVDRLLGHR